MARSYTASQAAARAAALLLAVLVCLAGATGLSDGAYDQALQALADRIESEPRNRSFRAAVERRLTGVHEESGGEISRRLEALNIAPMRVPGLYYRSHPGSGADLSATENWLGQPVALVPTDELGTVEANAATVAAAIRDATAGGGRLALFTASKGSADLRWALESNPEIGGRVALWVDMVGVLEGTPLTDEEHAGRLSIPSWLPSATADSMSEAVRRPRVSASHFPPEVRAVHVAAFPRVAEVSSRAQEAFGLLRNRGPNDGYVMLDSYLRVPGRVLIVRGADHYLRIPDLGPRLSAILLVLLDELEASPPEFTGGAAPPATPRRR